MDILYFITEDDCDDAHTRVAESSWTTETQQMRQKVWTDGTASGHKPLPSKASAERNRVAIQVKCLFTPMSLIFVAPLHDYNSSLQLMHTDEDGGFSWMPGQLSQNQQWTGLCLLSSMINCGWTQFFHNIEVCSCGRQRTTDAHVWEHNHARIKLKEWIRIPSPSDTVPGRFSSIETLLETK